MPVVNLPRLRLKLREDKKDQKVNRGPAERTDLQPNAGIERTRRWRLVMATLCPQNAADSRS